MFFGVSTLEGYFATSINSTEAGLPLPPTFIDQANSLRAGGTIMNVPYRSDHILNLKQLKRIAGLPLAAALERFA